MIWADRVGLAVAALIALCAACLTVVLIIGVGSLADGRLNATMALWAGIAEAAIAVPLWIILRLADLIFGGPRRRRARRVSGAERREPDLRDIALIPMEETAGD